jgi:hypothetical protein
LETKEIGDGDKIKTNVKDMTIIKTKDTNIAVVVGKKKKTATMEKKRIFQNAVVHILTTKTNAVTVAVLQKIKAIATMASEILAKTVITVGKNKLG